MLKGNHSKARKKPSTEAAYLIAFSVSPLQLIAGCDFRLNRLRFLRQSQFSEELRAVAASLAQRNFEPNCSRLVCRCRAGNQ